MSNTPTTPEAIFFLLIPICLILLSLSFSTIRHLQTQQKAQSEIHRLHILDVIRLLHIERHRRQWQQGVQSRTLRLLTAHLEALRLSQQILRDRIEEMGADVRNAGGYRVPRNGNVDGNVVWVSHAVGDLVGGRDSGAFRGDYNEADLPGGLVGEEGGFGDGFGEQEDFDFDMDDLMGEGEPYRDFHEHDAEDLFHYSERSEHGSRASAAHGSADQSCLRNPQTNGAHDGNHDPKKPSGNEPRNTWPEEYL